MRIIPVIDLKGGTVVIVQRDVANVHGARSITEVSPKPVDLVSRITQEFQCRKMFISDLDLRWNTGADNLEVIRELIASSLIEIWFDCGAHTLAIMARLGKDSSRVRPVLSSSFFHEPELLIKELKPLLTGDPIFSLELDEGHVVSDAPLLRNRPPADVITDLCKFGLRTFVLLERANIGTTRGLTPSREALLKTLTVVHKHVELVVGGGIASLDDLRTLGDLGIATVLVGSAIHVGLITPQMLQEL